MPTKRYTVTFVPDDVTIDVYNEAENLLRVAMVAGVHVNASCGGAGGCGKCKVRILEGEFDAEPSPKLSQEEWTDGFRLACKTQILGDLKVEIPVESRYETSALERKLHKAGDVITATHQGEEFEGLTSDPFVTRCYVEMEPPTEDDNVSDMGRLGQAIKRDYDIPKVRVDLDVLKAMPKVLREGDWKATASISQGRLSHRLVHVAPGDTRSCAYALGIDIGTTTVHASLLDLSTGEEVASAADYNGQMSMGEDVISRIVHSQREGGLDELQARVVKTINSVIKKALKKAKVKAEEVSHAVLGGNTTMTQMFIGLDPKYIREAPYVPVADFFPYVNLAELGVALPRQVIGYIMPCVASYVGGDITSGVLATGIHLNPELTLFMDVGTNGEIIIGNQDWMVSASASAGPCFEGGGVKYGMRATEGAIEQVRIRRDTYEPMLMTIGLTRPKGVCGSGIIDCLAEMVEAGVISQNGKINHELADKTPRVREGESGWEYVLCWADETQIGADIAIIEPDLDNVIRAKGAIFAACSVLLKSVGLGFSDLQRIILAGGFGHYVDVEKAMAIGLLPEVDPKIVSYGGNTSLTGCKIAALFRDKIEEVETVATMITNIELSASNLYMDEYVAALFLPHTRLEEFPLQAERLNMLASIGEPAA